MKIAIFGGSFDPPHKGHLSIVQEALKNLSIDLLIVVPAYRNPFKHSFAAPPKVRLQWLKKIFAPYKKVRICDYEIRQNRPTYTIETVEYLRRKYAPKKIYLIIGSDNLSTLHKWHQYRRLRRLVEFIVATRRGYKAKRFKRLAMDIPISSTALRVHPQKRYLPKIVANEIIDFYR